MNNIELLLFKQTKNTYKAINNNITSYCNAAGEFCK